VRSVNLTHPNPSLSGIERLLWAIRGSCTAAAITVTAICTAETSAPASESVLATTATVVLLVMWAAVSSPLWMVAGCQAGDAQGSVEAGR